MGPGGGTLGMIQQRSFSSLLCRRPLLCQECPWPMPCPKGNHAAQNVYFSRYQWWCQEAHSCSGQAYTHLWLRLPVPVCTADHTCLTEHTKKMGSLTQCPVTLYFSTDLFKFVCVYRLCNGLLYIVKKTVLLWKQTSCRLWKGGFDFNDLTIKFRYWSCSDAWCNRKNPVAVLKNYFCCQRWLVNEKKRERKS